MTKERWAYIKALPANSQRYTHISCYARMVKDDQGAIVPYIQKPGFTYTRTART